MDNNEKTMVLGACLGPNALPKPWLDDLQKREHILGLMAEL
jgi:hypothetical protein